MVGVVHVHDGMDRASGLQRYGVFDWVFIDVYISGVLFIGILSGYE